MREGLKSQCTICSLPPRSCLGSPATLACWKREPIETAKSRDYKNLVLLFTSLLTIPLACQSCLHATLFAWLEVVGVTLYFLDDVLLLDLTLKPAQCVLERFAFLDSNFCQLNYTPKPANWL